jgi:predicted nuclease of predicted toxin-antitoxin system
MRFVADQDVWAVTLNLLRSNGHDVVTASELQLSRADDEDLLAQARKLNRIMITRDRDYGGLVFVKNSGRGVVYLRITPTTVASVHDQLRRLLESHSEKELMRAFVVVEPGRYRFRKLKE